MARAVLTEALALSDDMSRACIRLSPASVRALEDVTDVSAMAGSLAALAFNPAGDISTDLVHRLDDLPPARPQGAGGRMARVTRSVSSRGVGDVGSLAAQCRVRAVAALPPVPVDVAGAEALAAGALVGSTVLISADEMAHAVSHAAVWAPSPEALAVGAGVALAADRYANRGEAAALLSRGAARLTSLDVEREATTEAAACAAGYALGLPWCALEARASRVARAAVLSLAQPPDRAVDRTLIWLLVPAAAEAVDFAPPLRAASPAEAASLLRLLRRGGDAERDALADGGWAADGSEDEVRVAWAYQQACRLVRQLGGARAQLRDAMAEGGLTAGGAVCALEAALR